MNVLRSCVVWASGGVGALAMLVAPAPAQQPRVLERGLPARNEPRVAGRMGQPGQERRTHRGWEVYGDGFLVLANTSQEDARLAARTFQSANAEARRQLELLVGPLPRGDQARAATQIVIDRIPAKPGEDAPLMRRSGQAISVHLDVSGGQPGLAEQLSSLQDAAAVQVVESYLAGPGVPESLRTGLAAFLARQTDVMATGDSPRGGAGLLAAGEASGATRAYQQLRADSTPRGKHPWLKPVVSAEQESGEAEEGRNLVEFLLTGYDGRFAASFGAVLRQAIERQEADLSSVRRASGRGATPGASPAVQVASAQAAAPGPLAEWLESLAPQYEAWRADPNVGGPIWEPLDKEDARLAERQRELTFVLRLLNRPGAAGVRSVEPKLIENTANGPVVRGGPGGGAGRPIDLAQWVRRESMSDARWAILDANGVLVWNQDAVALQDRLALDAGRYSAAWRDGRIVAREPLGEGRTLEAWLEPIPGDPWASRARFAIQTTQ